MASSSKKKTVVKQEDLRRLMKQKTTADKRRIESPIAKYNSLGQLSCAVCNLFVKNELLWNSHILSRTHKENVASVQSNSVNSGTVASLKRKATDSYQILIAEKLAKVAATTSSSTDFIPSDLPSDFFDSTFKTPNTKSMIQATSSLSHSENDKEKTVKLTVLAANYKSSDEEESSEDEVCNPSEVDPSPAAEISQLIPEGFFDDRKLDAKIRNVPYKDKLEEELELFNKSMKEESSVSEAIVEEDDERREEQKNIDEIDDQINRYSRINNLAQQKRPVVYKNIQLTNEDDDPDDGDYDVDSVCEWRNKMLWK